MSRGRDLIQHRQEGKRQDLTPCFVTPCFACFDPVFLCYLRTVFGFIGVTQLSFVHVGNDEFGGERLAESLRRARAEILEMASSADS